MLKDYKRIEIVNQYLWWWNKCGDCQYLKKYEKPNPYWSQPDPAFRCTLSEEEIQWPYRDPIPETCPMLPENKANKGEKQGEKENNNTPTEEECKPQPLAYGSNGVCIGSDSNAL